MRLSFFRSCSGSSYYDPARAGDGNELIATLFEVVRIERDYPEFEFRERKRSAVSATADSRPRP